MYGADVKEMEYGTELKEGEMKFTCLGPEGNTDDKSHNVTTGNESSMILHLEYGEFDMLFTGDVEKEGEERWRSYVDVIQEEKKITWENTKDSASWFEEFYNGDIPSDSLSAVCMDISREKEPLRTSA